MACMIEQILIMSVRQRGTSLGVKTAVTIHQQATFTSRSLARDRKAAKVTGGHVCFIARTITRYVGTERSDRPVFMRKTCFSPFKPYLQLRQTLLSNIYALEMHPWQKRYCSWSENWRIHLFKKRKLPLPSFASVATFYLSLSNTRHDHSFVKRHNTNLCIDRTSRTWRNWTLQSDWRALYRPRGTNRCMALLPDPFSIFPKGVCGTRLARIYKYSSSSISIDNRDSYSGGFRKIDVIIASFFNTSHNLCVLELRNFIFIATVFGRTKWHQQQCRLKETSSVRWFIKEVTLILILFPYKLPLK